MKKFFVLFALIILTTMTSCSTIKSEEPVYKSIDSEIEYCELMDDGHYEVSLILENGEKFVYHSKYDVTKITEKKEINMGYNTDEKVYQLAVINPSN